MPEREAKKTFAQILSAVEYCHKRHVVHRDLKVKYSLYTTKLSICLKLFVVISCNYGSAKNRVPLPHTVSPLIYI